MTIIEKPNGDEWRNDDACAVCGGRGDCPYSATMHPMNTRIGWWITVHVPSCDAPRGALPMKIGPNGGDFMAYGTRRRAERKARRLVRRYNRRAERKRSLTVHIGGPS